MYTILYTILLPMRMVTKLKKKYNDYDFCVAITTLNGVV